MHSLDRREGISARMMRSARASRVIAYLAPAIILHPG
jgi:hypothetical protein